MAESRRPRGMMALVLLAASSCALACGDDDDEPGTTPAATGGASGSSGAPAAGGTAGAPVQVTCGPGTRLDGTRCVPDAAPGGAPGSVECGPGTRLVGNLCVVDDAGGGTAGAGGSAGEPVVAGAGGEMMGGAAGWIAGGAAGGGAGGAGGSAGGAGGAAGSAGAGGTPWLTGLDIETHTNGHDADLPPGPDIPLGAPVQWEYVVTNTGAVTILNITVTDNRLGAVSCPASDLSVGESMTCTAAGVAAAGQYSNVGTAVGTVAGLGATGDTDPSHYWGIATP